MRFCLVNRYRLSESIEIFIFKIDLMDVSNLINEIEFPGEKLFNLVKKIGGNFEMMGGTLEEPLCQHLSLENQINKCRILFRDNFLYASRFFLYTNEFNETRMPGCARLALSNK